MDNRNLSHETGPVVDRIIAPFEQWAKTGYAEGVVDFLPSLGREPLLMSPTSLLQVFDAALYGLKDVDPSDEDKEECARRMEFIETLIDELMTRERHVRDQYYIGRNKGMIHRTGAMLVGFGIFTVASVTLPTWASVVTGTILVISGGAAFSHFSRLVKNRGSTGLYEGRAARVIEALPWMVSSSSAPHTNSLES
jgi:hypothetical protein